MSQCFIDCLGVSNFSHWTISFQLKRRRLHKISLRIRKWTLIGKFHRFRQSSFQPLPRSFLSLILVKNLSPVSFSSKPFDRTFLHPLLNLFHGAITSPLIRISFMVPPPSIGLAFDKVGPSLPLPAESPCLRLHRQPRRHFRQS